MALFGNLLSPELEQNFDYERSYRTTDNRVRSTVDNRSSITESTYSPTLILNSAGASASTVTKKEQSLSPTSSLTSQPTQMETRQDTKSSSPFTLDTTSPLLLIGAGVVAYLVFKK